MAKERTSRTSTPTKMSGCPKPISGTNAVPATTARIRSGFRPTGSAMTKNSRSANRVAAQTRRMKNGTLAKWMNRISKGRATRPVRMRFLMTVLLRGAALLHLRSGQTETPLPAGEFIQGPVQLRGIEIGPEHFGKI